MKIELEIILRCSKCLHLLKDKQNYPGSHTLFNVEPCQNCIEEEVQKRMNLKKGNENGK